MKRVIFISALAFLATLSTFAQVNEKISELNPYANYLASVRIANEKLKNVICIFGPEIKNSPIKIFVGVASIKLLNGKQVTSIVIRVPKDKLTFEDVNDKFLSRLEVFGRIRSFSKKIDGIFEDRQEVITDNFDDLKKTASSYILYRKNFNLPIGKYNLSFSMRDILSGATGKQSVNFVVE